MAECSAAGTLYFVWTSFFDSGSVTLPGRSPSSAHAALGRRRDHAFRAHVDRQNAVFFVAVHDEVGQHRAACDLVHALPHELERALIGQVRKRRIAERKRVGERLDDVGSRRLRLLEVRALVRIRFARGGRAGIELRVGDVRELPAEAANVGRGRVAVVASSNFCAVSVRFIFSVLYDRRSPSLSGTFCPPCAAAGACAWAVDAISTHANIRQITAFIDAPWKFRGRTSL